MGIFDKIMSKIFPSHAEAAPATQASAGPTAAGGPAVATSPVPIQAVDVEKILDDKSKASAEKLNWRTSIVDLMKLLGLDSSLAARKELATELHYSGDMNDSASMNIWLHRQVMTKLAANGGTVPADLKD
jgi:hypothetical protein